MLLYAWIAPLSEAGYKHEYKLAFTRSPKAPGRPAIKTIGDTGLVRDDTLAGDWQPAGCWLAEDVTFHVDGTVDTLEYGLTPQEIRHHHAFCAAKHTPSRARRI